MYQCISDKFDTCRRVYASIEDFTSYCKHTFGVSPALSPKEEGADSYYDSTGFVLVKVAKGAHVVASLG